MTATNRGTYAGHYRLASSGKWLLYVNGHIVASVESAEKDAHKRFGTFGKYDGQVNYDVLKADVVS